MTAADLRSVFKDDPWRLQLLANVDLLLDRLSSKGISVSAFLIGGGFVRRLRDGSKPNDIDGLALYTVAHPSSDVAIALAAAVRDAKKLHIDMRFCPMDANPLIMAKSLVFYSVLFSKSEGNMEIENGLILYERE